MVNKRVCPSATEQRVSPPAACEAIIALISRQGIVASTANRVFYHYALGNRHIPTQTTHIRKRLSLEVDGLVLGEPGKIECVVTPAIPNGENRFVTPPFKAVDIPTRIGIEAVGGIGIARLGIGAVEPLGRRDIVHHRCPWGTPGKIVPRLMGLVPITHDTACLGVLGIFGIALVIEALAIVFTWMAQPQGMPQFMDQQTQEVAAHCRVLPALGADIGRDFRIMTVRQACPASRSPSPFDSDRAIGV